MNPEIDQSAATTSESIPVQSVPVSPVSPSLKSKLPLILIVIVLLVVVGAGGIVLGKYLASSKTPVTVSSVISPVSTQTPIPTSDPTANWKTYTNTKYGYSFKYPIDAEFNDYKENPERYGVIFIGPEQKASGRIQTDLSDGYIFSVRVLASGETVDVAAERDLQSSKNVCLPETVYSSITSTIIDNQPARSYNRTKCYGDSTSSFVSNNKILFEISQQYAGNSSTESNYRKITDQILSTFKFLN